jgi:hypothetical protein
MSNRSRRSRSHLRALRVVGSRTCAVAAILVVTVSLASAQSVSRVSVSATGAQANADNQFAAVSQNGSVVAYASEASNLVPNDQNGIRDVFVHDRVSGAVWRASVSSSGVEGIFASSAPALSADGMVTAYESQAFNLVPDDTNGNTDVFVHDRMTITTTRVSVDANNNQGNQLSGGSRISADGLWVAFSSRASNLVPGDGNGRQDVFLKDLTTGAIRLVSLSSTGEQANNDCTLPSVSGNGRLIAWQSAATNLVPGDTNNQSDVFVHDRDTFTTVRVSVSSNGEQADGGSTRPSISADGRYVTFQSLASNLVAGDTNGVSDIFVHDLLTGSTTVRSEALGCSLSNGPSAAPAVSGDGLVVAFQSGATNLVTGDTNNATDIFVFDRSLVNIDLIQPTVGSESGNDIVRIFGTGFIGSTTTTITFGGVPATLIDISATFLRVRTPPGTGTVDVALSNSIGCVTAGQRFRYVPAEIAARFGNVNLGFGEREDVLLVNGSAGDFSRNVFVAVSSPIQVDVLAPTTTATARFVMYGWVGIPDASTLTPHPRGIGSTVFPTPVIGGAPQPVKIWNNLGFRGTLGQPGCPSMPAPSILVFLRRGAPSPVVGTLQGFIQDPGSIIAEGVSITNAVVLHVQ